MLSIWWKVVDIDTLNVIVLRIEVSTNKQQVIPSQLVR